MVYAKVRPLSPQSKPTALTYPQSVFKNLLLCLEQPVFLLNLQLVSVSENLLPLMQALLEILLHFLVLWNATVGVLVLDQTLLC